METYLPLKPDLRSLDDTVTAEILPAFVVADVLLGSVIVPLQLDELLFLVVGFVEEWMVFVEESRSDDAVDNFHCLEEVLSGNSDVVGNSVGSVLRLFPSKDVCEEECVDV